MYTNHPILIYNNISLFIILALNIEPYNITVVSGNMSQNSAHGFYSDGDLTISYAKGMAKNKDHIRTNKMASPFTATSTAPMPVSAIANIVPTLSSLSVVEHTAESEHETQY